MRPFSCSSTGKHSRAEPSTNSSQSNDFNDDSANVLESKKRIHVMGIGNIGSFVAHSLAGAPQRPPVTLLLHHPGMYETWLKFGQRITIRRHGLEDSRTGFAVNTLQDGAWLHPSEIAGSPPEAIAEERAHQNQESGSIPADEDVIDNLVLTLKATKITKALQSVQHRLTTDSTILFLCNGMGMIEDVNEKIFPDEATRPNYIGGIISHGIYRSGYFNATHAGVGVTNLGVLFTNPKFHCHENSTFAPSTTYLLNTMTQAPELVANTVNSVEFLQFQLEKLAINCVLNPLTALIECQNGEMLYNFNLSRVQRLLLIEISAVICALPELQGIPGIHARFAPERLRTIAVGVMKKTAENQSSMLQDMNAGRRLEIDYMNGYVVRRGEELGIKCALNYMLACLAQAKSVLLRKRTETEIPVDAEIPLHGSGL
ncbi:hypothetical protein FQN57_004874 [Myotisia sp. PD_48]|nr:hypothetical protein FQN57_004874 [Myotisia sp. PD_48]